MHNHTQRSEFSIYRKISFTKMLKSRHPKIEVGIGVLVVLQL